MGGAIALLLHRKMPDYWSGAILVAPMCKVRIILITHTRALRKDANLMQISAVIYSKDI